ncbi:NAD(P)H-dependent oxidoreductase [Hymenobacter koreensis]|uniref:NAD(P)H-dependent oxidoreductase n=1 Tax=Hymenobacter koreensis TaxID=1084523 RepID=A0ABP8J2D3_9BACT
MRIYLLLAHPDKDSFNGRLADAYEAAATRNGHEVRRQNLGDLDFDPILWKGYKQVQALEPDLQLAQQHLSWCEQWVIIYPIWWGSVPALLKGFFDRVLLSGYAYRYRQQGPFWDKLLRGRSAHVITTCDAPTWWIWWQYRNSDLNTVKRAVLEFCGISPVRVTRIGRMRYLTAQQREDQLAKVIRAIPLAKKPVDQVGQPVLAAPQA